MIALMTENIFHALSRNESKDVLPCFPAACKTKNQRQQNLSKRNFATLRLVSFRCASFRIVLRASPIVRKNPCYGRRMFSDLSVVLKISSMVGADVRRLEFEGVLP